MAYNTSVVNRGEHSIVPGAGTPGGLTNPSEDRNTLERAFGELKRGYAGGDEERFNQRRDFGGISLPGFIGSIVLPGGQ